MTTSVNVVIADTIYVYECFRRPPAGTGSPPVVPSNSGSGMVEAAAAAAANLVSQATSTAPTPPRPAGSTVFSVQPPTYHVQVTI